MRPAKKPWEEQCLHPTKMNMQKLKDGAGYGADEG